MGNKKCKARWIKAHRARVAAWRKRRAKHMKCMRNKKCRAKWMAARRKRMAAWRKRRERAHKARAAKRQQRSMIPKTGMTVAVRGGRGKKWCADEGNRVICNRAKIQGWEKFYIWSRGGKIALRGGRHKRWCADEYNRIRC